ncbi:MAG: pantoate--beta-alanine ligase [Pseudomonadota bacterium]|nr:pantoate--beta-alanine ligase [Pseudomonadota bacterium]
MHKVGDIAALREIVRSWRAAGERVGLVPTMGNLHAGHLGLVRRAKALAPRVVVSIFVNPTQFDRRDDLAAYPRTLEHDTDLLMEADVDLLFAPNESEIYPSGTENAAFVDVPSLSGILCGASRPGHFRGVATVVSKLFNMVQPDLAVFGEKDCQQLAVIRRLVHGLDFPVQVFGVPTFREGDGLAMSSRNRYLTPQERSRAPALYGMLKRISEALREGERDYAALEGDGIHELRESGFDPDYVSIRRQGDLRQPSTDDKELVVLAAARLGAARLIDNVIVGVERSFPV